MFPFKCCRNCQHYGMDMKALLRCGVVIYKCYLRKIYVLHPLLKKCRDWRKDNGN